MGTTTAVLLLVIVAAVIAAPPNQKAFHACVDECAGIQLKAETCDKICTQLVEMSKKQWSAADGGPLFDGFQAVKREPGNMQQMSSLKAMFKRDPSNSNHMSSMRQMFKREPANAKQMTSLRELRKRDPANSKHMRELMSFV